MLPTAHCCRQARTSFIVWALLQPTEICTEDVNNLTTFVIDLDNLPFLLPFTACDSDALVVQHRLPSRTDSRQLSADATTVDSIIPQSVEYTGEGHYFVPLVLKTSGHFTLRVRLGELVYARSGTSHCGAGKALMLDRTCGCPAGREPIDRTCSPCTAGKQKITIGNDMCVDKPRQV